MKRQMIAFAGALCASAAFPMQTISAQALPGANQDYQAMMEALQTAQAAASQPGDEELTCDQLQEQIVVVANDPAFQAFVQTAGAKAQKDLATMEAAKAQIATQAVQTIIASMVPGGAMAQVAASAAQAPVQQAQAAERVQSVMMQGQQMMAFMPKLMRGQRLIELGGAKNCEWAQGAMSDSSLAPERADSGQ
jgi:hypothetical protein